MERLERGFATAVVRWRWLWLVLLPVLVLALGSGGKNLKFSTDYRVFFSADNPELLAFEHLENTYTKNDNVMLVLTPQDGQVLTPKTMQAIEAITAKAWQIPYAIRVDSLSNYQHTEAEGDDLSVHDLFEDAATYSPEQVAAVRQVALHEPLLLDSLINPQGSVTGINATIQLPGIDPTKETPEIVAFVRTLADQIRQDYPWLTVHVSGMTMMNNAFAENSQHDMKTLVMASFVLMLLLLGLLTRSIAGTVGVLLVIIMSVMAAMGAAGFIGYPITPPSASAPTIILTIAIASSVHVLVAMLRHMRAGMEKHAAIRESLRINLQPVFIASITTAIGFLSMNASDVPPFHHLGNITSIGVLVSFVLTVVFLPAFMAVLPLRIKPARDDAASWNDAVAAWVVRQQKPLFWGMGALIVLLFASVPKNELNDVFVEYFDTTIDFRVSSDYMTAHLTGLYRIDYSLESGEKGGISKPDFLREVKAFADWYRKQPEVLHVNTITDTFMRLNKSMHGDDVAYYRLPESRELAAQYLLLYEMSLPYGLDLNNQIDIDKSATRFSVNLTTLSTNEIMALIARSNAWIVQHGKAIVEARPSGPTVMFAHIGQRNIISMLGGTAVALILISGILILALRSLKVGLISLVPNLVPAGMGFGLWAWTVGDVGLSLSIVSGMTLGIVVDDTVHFLSKYLRARREKGMSAVASVHYAYHHVGSAIIVTTVVLVAGFLVLATSHFQLNSGMGLLSALVLTFALLADFFFLPVLLLKLDNDHEPKNPAAV